MNHRELMHTISKTAYSVHHGHFDHKGKEVVYECV